MIQNDKVIKNIKDKHEGRSQKIYIITDNRFWIFIE